MNTYIAVAIGGAIGALTRYGIGLSTHGGRSSSM